MTDTGAELPSWERAGRAPTAVGRAPQRGSEPVGWWGFVLFLCAEITLFGTIIGSYFYLDFSSPRWPPAGIPAPEILEPAVSTGVLVALTLLLYLAARNARRGERWRTVWLLTFVALVQMAYLGFQIALLRANLLQFYPQANAYASVYYTVLVADHAHVLFGILLNGLVIYKLAVRGLDRYWLVGVRGVALYWYVVNFLTAAVLVTTLSPSL